MNTITYKEKGAYLVAIGMEMMRHKVCADAAAADDTAEHIQGQLVELLDCTPERAKEIWGLDLSQALEDNEV